MDFKHLNQKVMCERPQTVYFWSDIRKSKVINLLDQIAFLSSSRADI
jgi:hypothetical protein